MVSVFGAAPRNVDVNYEAHSGQQEVSEAIRANMLSGTPASIIEIIASRAWGKTLYLVCEALVPLLESSENIISVMWVAPSQQVAMTPIDDVFKGINEAPGELFGKRFVPQFDEHGNKIWDFATTKSGPVLTWYTGSKVYFKSAGSPDAIVSKGFNLIIIDEAALIKEQTFTQQIMGTARKAGVKIFMITSPRGKKHWTYNTFVKGQDPTETEYLSFQQPWSKNPSFSETLKKMMADLPEWLRRQEYEAEFVEDGDVVFKGLDNIFYGERIEFQSKQQEWKLPVEDIIDKQGNTIRHADERRFITAMDIAKAVDFTVITVTDLDSADLVYYRRLNKTDYRQVLQLAADVCQTYNNAELIFDATGVGSGLADMLNNYDIVSHPFVFTNESKNDIVNKLILAVEYQQIRLPNIKTVRDEFNVFTYEVTRTGKISYNAPTGFHDDIIMSLALGNWFRIENSGTNEAHGVDNIIDYNSQNMHRPRSFLEEMAEDDD